MNLTKNQLVRRARRENQQGVRMRRHGYLGLADQCFWFARGYLKEARQR